MIGLETLTSNQQKRLEKSLKFFSLAEAAAQYSKDKSTKVGSVALDENHNLICIGYNGFPRRVKDIPERHERPMKYSVTCHAEENVVSQAAYMGASLRGATLLVTALFPCSTCTRLIIQSGIEMVITSRPQQLSFDGRKDWSEEEEISRGMFLDAGIPVIYYDKETNNCNLLQE